MKPGSTLDVALTGVPAGAIAVEVNVTVTNPTGSGDLNVYPTGAPTNSTSILDFTKGQTVANMATVGVGKGNSITLADQPATGGSTDVVVDLLGYYRPQSVPSAAGSYNALSPTRIADTRCAPKAEPLCATEDLPSANAALTTLGAHGTMNVQASGEGGVPASGHIEAVLVNLTAVKPTAGTFLAAYATGSPPPATGLEFSNLNASPGENVAAKAIVKVNSAGQFTVFNHAGNTNVVVDVDGYFSSGSGPTGAYFTPLPSPLRVIGTLAAGQSVPAGSSASARVAGANGIPANATAAALSVVDIKPAKGNFLTVYPSNSKVPVVSGLNWIPGNPYDIVANAAFATLSNSATRVPAGSFSVYNGPPDTVNNAGPTDVDADVYGYFAPARRIVVSANPKSLPADGASRSEITVSVSGASGAKDAVLLKGTGACGTFTPRTGSTGSTGTFTSVYTASTTAGTCTITATEANNGETASTAVTQTAFNTLAVTSSPATLKATGSSTATVTATVKDGTGKAVAGDTVTFSSSGGAACGTLSPRSAKTSSSGVATTTYTSSKSSGFCVIRAAESQAHASDTYSMDQTASPTPANTPFAVKASASPASIPADGKSTSKVSVTVKDSTGTAVANDPVSLSGTSASCTSLTPAIVSTDSAGVATFTYTASTTAGTCSLTAEEAFDAQGAKTAVAQKTMDSVALAAAPQSIPANGTSTSKVTATVTDQKGASVSGDTVDFFLGANCGSLSAASGKTDASGQAFVTYTSSKSTGFCKVGAKETATGSSASIYVTQTQS